MDDAANFRILLEQSRASAESPERDGAPSRSASEGALTVIARLDREFRHLFISSAITTATGVPVEAYLGKTNEELGHPSELCALWTKTFREVFATGEQREVEFSYDSPYGPTSWTMRVVPETDREGAVASILVVSTDLTGRKKVERALRESEARLRLYFNSSIIGNIVGTLSGGVLEANDEYLRIIGYSREELQAGQVRWDAITPPEHLVLDRAAIDLAKKTGFGSPYEKQYIRKDGTRIWVLVGFVTYGADDTIAFVLDISAQKAAEAALRDAQMRLRHYSEQLEKTVESRTAKLHETIDELEHFSYAIVHDLRAPLRAMEGYADMMEEELSSGQTVLTLEYLRRIKQASQRMDRLITDSLNYSKAARQELTLEPVDLFQLIDGLVQSYPNLRAEEADICIDRNLPLVTGNVAALTQCFANLLGNAVKFRKENCPAIVRVRAGKAQVVPNETPSASSVTYIRIWVEDDGIGISPEAQQRIFGLFQRGSREREGTGLGLAIVKKVVERMGGRVGVESAEGEGSRFWVDLFPAGTSTVPSLG